MLSSLLTAIESAFPVQALYVDVAKGKIEEKSEDEDAIDKMWADLQTQMDYVRNNNLSVKDYYTMFMKVEPYCNHKEIVERIQKEIAQYE